MGIIGVIVLAMIGTMATGSPAADEYMRTAELSRLTRIPVGTLRQWRHRGFGPPGFRAGGVVLYRRADVDAWLEAQQRAEIARTPYSGATA